VFPNIDCSHSVTSNCEKYLIKSMSVGNFVTRIILVAATLLLSTYLLRQSCLNSVHMLKHVYIGIIKRGSKKLSRVKTMWWHCSTSVWNRTWMPNTLEHLVRYIIIAMAIWRCSHRTNYILYAVHSRNLVGKPLVCRMIAREYKNFPEQITRGIIAQTDCQLTDRVRINLLSEWVDLGLGIYYATTFILYVIHFMNKYLVW